ncbi:MAG: hypothetical protein L3J87_05830, partial [Thermoplasmata archaeon]|nr:hypothetical protein [Thermoplasmata archaeon]
MTMRWNRLLAVTALVLLLPAASGAGAAPHGAHAPTASLGTVRPGALHRPTVPPPGYPVDSWPTYLSNPERTGANL